MATAAELALQRLRGTNPTGVPASNIPTTPVTPPVAPPPTQPQATPFGPSTPGATSQWGGALASGNPASNVPPDLAAIYNQISSQVPRNFQAAPDSIAAMNLQGNVQGFDMTQQGIMDIGETVRRAAQLNQDRLTKQKIGELADFLGSKGIANSGILGEEAGKLMEANIAYMANVEAQIATNSQKMWSDAVNSIRDTQLKEHMMGLQAYYDTMSQGQKDAVTLSIAQGDIQKAFRLLDMTQTFDANQNELNRRFESGKQLNKQEWDRLMQNEAFANQWRSDRQKFNETVKTMVSEQEFKRWELMDDHTFQVEFAGVKNMYDQGLIATQAQYEMLKMDHQVEAKIKEMTAEANLRLGNNPETGRPYTEFEIFTKQQKLTQQIRKEDNWDEYTYKVALMDKDTRNQIEIVQEKMKAELGIQDAATFVNVMLTQGSAAAYAMQVDQKLARTDLSPADRSRLETQKKEITKYLAMRGARQTESPEYKALDAKYGGGPQSSWSREDEIGTLEFQRHALISSIASVMKTEEGGDFLSELMNNGTPASGINYLLGLLGAGRSVNG